MQERHMLLVAKKAGYPGIYGDVSSGNIVSLNLQRKAGFRKLVDHPLKKRYPNRNVVFVKRF
jgi:hypothetical protein